MKRTAFGYPPGMTLLEILVTITIIMVLAAAMMPIISGARANAKDTRCIANLKGWGEALAMYSADWDTWFPYHTNTSCQGMLVGFGDYADIRDPCTEMSYQEIWDGTIIRCPADTGPVDPGGSGAPAYGRYYSYSPNYRMTNSPHNRLSGIRNPMRVIFMGDAVDWRILEKDDASGDGMQRSDGYQSAHERHDRWVNFVFADGHVQPTSWRTGEVPEASEMQTDNDIAIGPPYRKPALFVE